MSELLDHVEFVRALDVPADAVIVVKSNRRLTREQAAQVQEMVGEAFLDRKVLVLPPDFDVVVVRDMPE